jgi:hypothetical protein
MNRLRALILEGPDRVGKGTQIALLRKHFAESMKPFHVLHYSAIKTDPATSRTYFGKLYDSMFDMLTDDEYTFEQKIMCLDRAHISEAVYAPMYRDYDGEYVFDIERKWMNWSSRAMWEGLALVTFMDDPASLLARDDGESHSTNYSDKVDEMERFSAATMRSSIEAKTIININGLGPEEVNRHILGFLRGRFRNV